MSSSNCCVLAMCLTKGLADPLLNPASPERGVFD